MMNLFVVCLLLCSSVLGGVSSPPKPQPKKVTILEFDGEKIPIDQSDSSPPPPPSSSEPSLLEKKLNLERSIANSVIDTTKSKFKQASSVLPDMEPDVHPRELLCDAFGKCKHKLAGVLGRAKEGASEKAADIEDAVEKGKASVVGKVDQAKQGGELLFETAKEGLGGAKDSLYGAGEKTAEKATEAGKNLGEDLKKIHTEIWDDRSLDTKVSSLLHESRRNISSIFHKGTSALNTMGKRIVSKEVVDPTIGVAHLLATSTAYGTMIWVTFVSSNVLSEALPRQQFGVVQSRLYPVYFQAVSGSIGCALVAHALRNPYLGLGSFQAYNMLAALGFVLLNMLLFEPNATKVMFEKMRLEKEEGKGRTGEEGEGEKLVGKDEKLDSPEWGVPTIEPDQGTPSEAEEKEQVRFRLEEMDKRLQKLNEISSWLNVLTLVSLTWQLAYMGKAMTTV